MGQPGNLELARRWAIAYPVVSCSPLLTSGGTAGGTVATGIASFVVGATLFFLWIVGIIILGILVMLSKGGRSPADRPAPKPQPRPTNWNVETAEPDVNTRSPYWKP